MYTNFIDLIASIIIKIVVFLFLYGIFPGFFQWCFRKIKDIFYLTKKIRIFIHECLGTAPAQLAGRDAERRYQWLLFCQFGSYRVLKDVYLPHPYKENRFTEIDVLLIHKRGVFSGEIKNYSGYISGKASQKEWLLEGRNRSFYFRNPFIQNQLHIDALLKTLPQANNHIFGFVGMMKNSNINGIEMDYPPTPNSHHQILLTENYLKKSYFSFNRCYQENLTLTKAEMKEAYQILKPYAHRSKEFKHQHLIEIENDFKEKAARKANEAKINKQRTKPNNITRIY